MSRDLVAEPLETSDLDDVLGAYSRWRSGLTQSGYEYYVSTDELRTRILMGETLCVRRSGGTLEGLLTFSREPSAFGCYDPEVLQAEFGGRNDVAYLPVGGFVPLGTESGASVLQCGLETARVAAVFAGFNQDAQGFFGGLKDQRILDEMILARFPMSTTGERVDVLGEDVSLTLLDHNDKGTQDDVWEFLRQVFKRSDGMTSPCPQLPEPEEYRAYVQDERVSTSLMWKQGSMIGVSVVVPARIVSFLGEAFAEEDDRFIYDIAMAPGERDAWYSGYLLRFAMSHLPANSRVSYDYSARVNRRLPLGVARGLSLKRGDIAEVDRMRYVVGVVA